MRNCYGTQGVDLDNVFHIIYFNTKEGKIQAYRLNILNI